MCEFAHEYRCVSVCEYGHMSAGGHGEMMFDSRSWRVTGCCELSGVGAL